MCQHWVEGCILLSIDRIKLLPYPCTPMAGNEGCNRLGVEFATGHPETPAEFFSSAKHLIWYRYSCFHILSITTVIPGFKKQRGMRGNTRTGQDSVYSLTVVTPPTIMRFAKAKATAAGSSASVTALAKEGASYGDGTPTSLPDLSIQNKMLVIILPLIVVPMLLLGAVGFFTSSREAAKTSTSYLKQRENDLRTIAENPTIRDYHNNLLYGLTEEAEIYRRELERSLQRFADRSNSIELVYTQVRFVDYHCHYDCLGRAGGSDQRR